MATKHSETSLRGESPHAPPPVLGPPLSLFPPLPGALVRTTTTRRRRRRRRERGREP